jgi:hypothetical protein
MCDDKVWKSAHCLTYALSAPSRYHRARAPPSDTITTRAPHARPGRQWSEAGPRVTGQEDWYNKKVRKGKKGKSPLIG